MELNEINVCCPYFDTRSCGDTDEHLHLYCNGKGKIINNSDTIFKCISNHNWDECPHFPKNV
jgi:hypothetical protein